MSLLGKTIKGSPSVVWSVSSFIRHALGSVRVNCIGRRVQGNELRRVVFDRVQARLQHFPQDVVWQKHGVVFKDEQGPDALDHFPDAPAEQPLARDSLCYCQSRKVEIVDGSQSVPDVSVRDYFSIQM